MKVRATKGFLLSLFVITLFSLVAFTGVVDIKAEASVDAALKRALVAFAAARGLNAVISAAQGTEVSVSPFGMGVALAPGEVLDPVNDLVERFSGFMLVSSVALGSQRVLLEISGWMPYTLFLAVLGVLLVLLQCISNQLVARIRYFLWRLFFILAIVRFIVPIVIIGSEWAYASFLENRYVAAEMGITQASERVRSLNTEHGVNMSQHASAKSSWEKLKDWAETTKSKAAAAVQLNQYSEALKETTKDAIELLVVFFLYTFVFPVAIIYMLWKCSKLVLSRSLDPPKETG